MLQGVRSGAELALRGSGASRFFGIGTVSGELGGGNGLGRLRIGVRGLIRDRLRVWCQVFHRSHSSKRGNGLQVGQGAEVPKIWHFGEKIFENICERLKRSRAASAGADAKSTKGT